ncbi:MAG: flagellar export chaperone FliS [Myxococcota bacterium]|nr:flagellar export chaperone FliS [Myxococcota bacterium]
MSLSRYRRQDVLTESPQGLVVKLYEAALRHCRAAETHHREGRIAQRGSAISRALAIVAELRCALNHDEGGEIARNLDSLYVFVNDRLLEAHVARRPEAIGEARQILAELHGAWTEVARQTAATPTQE